MAELSLVLRVVLAAVLLVAAGAKAADPSGTVRASLAFGLPTRLARASQVFLPLSEALCAVALLTAGPTARLGAVGAVLLLAAFTVAIARSLRQGRPVECNCFGAAHRGQIGPQSIVRNVVLLTLGLAGALLPVSMSAASWLRSTLDAAAVSVLAVGAFVLAVVFVSAFTSRLRRPLSADGLPIGAAAPSFVLGAAHGDGSITVPKVGDSAIVFVSPGCGPCAALLPAIPGWATALEGRLAIQVVSAGDQASVVEHLADAAWDEGVEVAVDADAAMLNAYGVSGTPSAVLVDRSGRVASEVAGGAEAIIALISEVTGVALEPVADERPSGVGSVAPGLRGRTVDDELFDLRSLRGSDVVAVFWDPTCGYCGEMKPLLQDWERSLDPDDPRLVIISSGSRDAHADDGFQAPVIVDMASAFTRFGVDGTPMAVLVDADGLVASEVAAGSHEVLALARGARVLRQLADGRRVATREAGSASP